VGVLELCQPLGHQLLERRGPANVAGDTLRVLGAVLATRGHAVVTVQVPDQRTPLHHLGGRNDAPRALLAGARVGVQLPAVLET
jgi:hypothetical protein